MIHTAKENNDKYDNQEERESENQIERGEERKERVQI